MATINIDGIDYSFDPEQEQNKPLLLFAMDQGVEIPYFCYHPSMSAPTNCRMCLCLVGFPMFDRQTGEPVLDENGEQKINWGRKPATACSQKLADGMIVRTQDTSPIVQKAQKGVLEFMLINHPLDCPICDQAGECPLQIQTYKYGPEGSRFELDKVHKPKRIELGPRVTLDAERCINCTRCTRFTEEISGSNQLTIISRGDKNFPATAPGQEFDDEYSMNTIDLCPVGALTSTDFRFKARAWEMNYTPSIDTTDAMGCNIDVWVRDNEILRITPRENMEVNQYWIPDENRLNYHRFNERRVAGVKLKGDVPASWEEGYRHASDLLTQHKGSILFLGSARASVESNYALQHLAGQLGQQEVFFVPHIEEGRADHLLKTDDVTPNRNGCLNLGLTEIDEQQLEDKLTSGGYSLVYSLEDGWILPQLLEQFKGEMIVHAYHYVPGHDQITVLFPAAMEVEQPATFVNIQGKPQVTQQAKQIKHMTPEDWMSMAKSRLDAGGQLTDRWRKEEHIIDVLASWRICMNLAELQGSTRQFARHKDIFKQLKAEYEWMQAAQKPEKIRKEAFKHSQFEFGMDLRAKTM